eukprot:PhF_6_TR34210/c1_g1_i1/m.50159
MGPVYRYVFFALFLCVSPYFISYTPFNRTSSNQAVDSKIVPFMVLTNYQRQLSYSTPDTTETNISNVVLRKYKSSSSKYFQNRYRRHGRYTRDGFTSSFQWFYNVPHKIKTISIIAFTDEESLSLRIGGKNRHTFHTLPVLNGFHPCFRINLAHFSRHFPEAVMGPDIVLSSKSTALIVLEAFVITQAGKKIVLSKHADLDDVQGDATTPGACKFSDQNLRTRNDVLLSMHNHISSTNNEALRAMIPLHKDCVVLSAALGSYEKCLHPVFPPITNTNASSNFQRRCMAILFTDQDIRHLKVHPDWTVVHTPYHMNDNRLLNASGMSRGKYYKMQAYKLLPTHVRYVMWLDATVEVLNASEVDMWFETLQRGSTQIVTAPHLYRNNLLSETCMSYEKYNREFANIVSDYLGAVEDGFCEEYWFEEPNSDMLIRDLAIVIHGALCNDESPLSTLQWSLNFAQSMYDRMVQGDGKCAQKSRLRNFHHTPVYVTCMVLLDLYSEKVRHFLDYWYESTMWHQQDQISFSIGVWRYGLSPRSIGFDVLATNTVLKKHDHGKYGCGI